MVSLDVCFGGIEKPGAAASGFMYSFIRARDYGRFFSCLVGRMCSSRCYLPIDFAIPISSPRNSASPRKRPMAL